MIRGTGNPLTDNATWAAGDSATATRRSASQQDATYASNAVQLAGPGWRLPQYGLPLRQNANAVRGDVPSPVVVAPSNAGALGRRQQARLRTGHATPASTPWRRFYGL